MTSQDFILYINCLLSNHTIIKQNFQQILIKNL